MSCRDAYQCYAPLPPNCTDDGDHMGGLTEDSASIVRNLITSDCIVKPNPQKSPIFFLEGIGFIERLHVMSLRSRLRRKTENSRHVGVQRDRSFYGDLHEMSDILIMLLICVESDKIPLLHKLKQLYKRLPVGVLIDIAYTANNILYKLYTKMAVYF